MPKKDFQGIKRAQEEMKRLAQSNSAKRVTALQSDIAELRKSPMLERPSALQTVLASKLAEFRRITGT
jgi:hypothetical protein